MTAQAPDLEGLDEALDTLLHAYASYEADSEVGQGRISMKRYIDARSDLLTLVAIARGELCQEIKHLQDENALLRSERDQLMVAVEFAHAEGFEWPADPVPASMLHTGG